MQLTEQERVTRHRCLLETDWTILAGFAWRQYLTKGRGGVVVDEEDFISAGNPGWSQLRLRYVAEGGERLREIAGSLADKVTALIKGHDPEKQIVVLILSEDGGTKGYIAEGPSRPAEAYAQRLPV